MKGNRMTNADRSKIALTLLFGMLALPVIVGNAGAQQDSWPRFHGPRNDNISDDKNLLDEWPDGGPRLI